MKRITILILTLLLTIFFVGCGVYTTESSKGNFTGREDNTDDNDNNNNSKDPDKEKDPSNDDDPDDGASGYTFTVTLSGGPEVISEELEAIWTSTTNKKETYSAKFIDGVATAEGLNGEYNVTLSDVSKLTVGKTKYSYNCNAYSADNDKRDIVIKLSEILSIGPTTKLNPNNDSAPTSWYNISKYGTYQAEIKSATDVIGFMFQPKENGSFYINSWCDVTANKINPKLRVYNGHMAYCNFIEEIDDGGISGTFTKNFKYIAQFADANIGGVAMFAIKANVNNVAYPVTVDFNLSREGDYEMEELKGDPVYAHGPYATTAQQNPTGGWRYIYEDNVSRDTQGNIYNIQDESKVVYNAADGFYHVGTTDGPLLYAKLTKDCEVVVTLDLSGAWVNQGFFWNTTLYEGGMMSLIWGGLDYSYMINGTNERKGYADYCDYNGAHPVTQEIKNFLQGFAANSSAQLFKDGEGWAEIAENNANSFNNPGGLNLQSDERSMWLFACGYYR